MRRLHHLESAWARAERRRSCSLARIAASTGKERMGKREEDEKETMEYERTEKYGTGTDATEGGEKEQDRTET